MKRYDCPICQRDAMKARLAFASARDTDDYLAYDCIGHDPNAPEWDPHGRPPAKALDDIPTPQELLAASPDYSATIAEDLSMIVGRLRMNPRSPVALRRVVPVVETVTKGGARDNGASDELVISAPKEAT